MISIIVPVYNVAQYLPKCIESLIGQTYTDLQIILINDGSTDNSGAICDSFAKKDDRIIVIHQKNQGVSVARNQGLAVATGEYIGFVDPDDWCELNMYAEMLKVMQQTNVDLVICGYSIYDKSYNFLVKSCDINHSFSSKLCDKDYESIWRMSSEQTFFHLTKIFNPLHFGPCNKLYKKTFISKLYFKVGLRYGEDSMFVSEYIYKIEKSALLRKPLYNIYNRENSASRGGLTGRSLLEFFEFCIEYIYIKGMTRYPKLEGHLMMYMLKNAYISYSEIKKMFGDDWIKIKMKGYMYRYFSMLMRDKKTSIISKAQVIYFIVYTYGSHQKSSLISTIEKLLQKTKKLII